MFLRINLTLNPQLKQALGTGFRADWKSPNKPDFNCAAIVSQEFLIAPGDTAECTIQPLYPPDWQKVVVGEVLELYWGPIKKLGEATVLEIDQENDNE